MSQSRFLAVPFLAIAIMGTSYLAASAQSPAVPTVKLVEPAAPLLPKQFGSWQQVPPDAGAPADVPDDASMKTVMAEDGLSRTAFSTYKADASSATLSIKAYQFGDATGAFSAFTLLRTPEYHAVRDGKIGTMAVEKGDSLLVWDGLTIVAAEFHGSHHAADLTALVAVLPKIGGPKGLAPLLPTLLPVKGLESETLKYSLGPAGYQAMGGTLPTAILGFDKSAEIVTAKYDRRGLLTLLLYPTPQIAGDHGRQIEAEMNREGSEKGTVKLRREGPLVLMTSGAWPAAEAQALVENIHLNAQVSWNKPMPLEFHAEVRKTASLLVQIAELSGVLMLAAVIMGLFFGGGRALIRVMQGKPAASEPEFLGINLREGPGEGGSFKPLH